MTDLRALTTFMSFYVYLTTNKIDLIYDCHGIITLLIG